jgi:signal transduction histidine kinase
MAETLGVQGLGVIDAADISSDAPRAQRSELSSARVLGSLGAAMLVCVLTVVSIQLSRPVGLAAVWPATGVAVVGWLKGPRSMRFDAAYVLFVALAYAIGGILSGNTFVKAGLFTFAAVMEAALAVYLIRRFTPKMDLSSLNGLLRFLFISPIVATFPSAVLVGSFVQLQGMGDFMQTAQTWWFGHALGLAVVTPFGLSLTPQALRTYSQPLKLVELVVILGATVFVSMFVFFQHDKPVGFLVTPLLLLAAVRLRMLGATAAVVIVSTAAILGVISDDGPTHIMAGVSVAAKVRLMQLYCIFGALPALPIAALLDERDRLAKAAQEGKLKAEAASAGKSRLLANVSHEIKSPVAGIIGIGELWQGGKLGAVTNTQEEMAAMLVRTARQVEALAYDLLDVAHAEAGTVAVKLQPVDLDAVVEDVRRSIAVKPEAQGIQWAVEGRGEKMTALADSVRVVQIVTNLVTNAVKYGASGGVVRLKLSRPAIDRVRLEVEDHGPGIPLAKQPELFEPFNRLGMEKSTVEGHGIGLALARRLAELQGGTISFQSAPGQGSRFWLELPAAR